MKLVTLIEKRDIFIEKSLSIEMTKVGQEFIIYFFKMSLQDIITILLYNGMFLVKLSLLLCLKMYSAKQV